MSATQAGRGLRDDERGQAIVLLAIVMAGLLMMVGLAIDAGKLYVARRTMQEAADAAAYGGAVVIYMGGTQADARAAAFLDAAKNGYAAGGDVTLTVNSAPTSGPYAGNAAYVEVIVQDRVRTFLVPAQSALTLVRVRAVAGAAPASSSHAIMALQPTGNDAFKMSGNGQVTVSGGGLFVNSNDVSSAAHLSGSASLTATYTRVVGGYQDSGPGNFVPLPTTGVPAEADPFAGVPNPPVGGLTERGFVKVTSSPWYLDPGIYDGIQVSSDATVYFRPGFYILRDKALQVSGNGQLLMDPASPPSEGVLLFNTLGSYPSPGGDCDQIQFSGNGVISLRGLSAAQSAQYKGMVVFQDRNCEKDMQISGNSTWAATGTIYLPSAGFASSGNGTINSTAAQLVAQTVQVSGNAAFALTYNAGLTAAPLIPALSE